MATTARPDDDDPVVVDTFAEPMGGELAVLRLAQEGIDGALLDSHQIQVFPLANVMLGDVKLVVRAADAGRARPILAELRRQAAVPKCPECGSVRLTCRKTGKRLTWLAVLLLEFPFGPARGRCRCDDCGHTWRA